MQRKLANVVTGIVIFENFTKLYKKPSWKT